MPEKLFHIEKIISGGQTGVDRAALDLALESGIPCGGWCPRGRKAEDGRIDARYPLEETHSADYRVRTERNVRDSDGTLVITSGPMKGGTALTVTLARKYKKPCLAVDFGSGGDQETVREWVQRNGIRTLNMAGPRESEVPGIHDRTIDFLRGVFNIKVV